MDGSMEERVHNLELRVAKLEAGSFGIAEQVGGIERTADSGGAEALFDTLLTGDQVNLISYSEAYRRLVGPYDSWRNAVHAPEIVRLARDTAVRRIRGLDIRLDALIVGKETRRPAKGHFESASYSEAQWIQTFGAATLLG